jgi:hypothetical protein
MRFRNWIKKGVLVLNTYLLVCGNFAVIYLLRAILQGNFDQVQFSLYKLLIKHLKTSCHVILPKNHTSTVLSRHLQSELTTQPFLQGSENGRVVTIANWIDMQIIKKKSSYLIINNILYYISSDDQVVNIKQEMCKYDSD